MVIKTGFRHRAKDKKLILGGKFISMVVDLGFIQILYSWGMVENKIL